MGARDRTLGSLDDHAIGSPYEVNFDADKSEIVSLLVLIGDMDRGLCHDGD